MECFSFVKTIAFQFLENRYSYFRKVLPFQKKHPSLTPWLWAKTILTCEDSNINKGAEKTKTFLRKQCEVRWIRMTEVRSQYELIKNERTSIPEYMQLNSIIKSFTIILH